VLGCFGLGQGAVGVLVVNAFYGLCLVIVHSLLLGEEKHFDGGESAQAPPERAGEYQGGRRLMLNTPEKNDDVGWLIQIMDLDIGWGHELMGFDDQTNMIAGLIYGVIIICSCAYMFHAVQTGGGSFGLPATTRWFVAFMNLELLLYVGIVLVKLPKLCKMQVEFMPTLTMECSVQKFMFLQRAVFLLTAASLCIWVFSSYAFSITFGNVQMDNPEFADHLEMRDAAITGKPPPGSMGLGPAPPYQTRGTPPYQTRQSLAPQSGRASLVGPAVQAASSFRSTRSSPTTMPPPGGGRTSYNIGSMARAGSSMVSTTSERSNPETQSLIKPPLHVY